MTDEIVVPSQGARKKPFILFRIAQWVVAAFFGLVALAATAEISKLGIPGAPIALYWSGLTALSLAAIILSPPLFFRLPFLAKIGTYVGGFAAVMLFGTYAGQMKIAYERTPTGAAEAKAKAQTDALLAKADAVNREAEAKVAAVAEAEKAHADNDRKLERCFSYLGHAIPKLTSQVKDSLENPASFEYIRTDKLNTFSDEAPYNVELFFRAENGFSAIRSVSVQAKINPDDCSVVDISNISD